MKAKIRSYGHGATDFHTRKTPEADSNYICCSVILIYSVLKMDENHNQQVLLKQYKYIEKEKKQQLDMYTDDLRFSSDYSNESDEK